ncbi:hypothetical protein JCM8202_005481 [Rhodotorula sphaerocarpa]
MQRPTKRKRTQGPDASPNAVAEASAAVDAENASRDNNTANNAPELGIDKGKAKETAQDEEEIPPRDLEEMERIYDMLAEEYHDIVAELPIEYQRTFLLMRELEDQQTARTDEFKSALLDYIASTLLPTSATPSAAPSPAPSTSTADEPIRTTVVGRDKMLRAAQLATAAVRAGEDKVGLAITLYEAVGRHIQRLDADLARYEDSLVIGLRDGTLPSHDAPSAIRKSPPGPTTSLAAIALGEREAYEGDEGGPGGAEGGDGHRRGRGAAAAGAAGAAAASGREAKDGSAGRTTRKKPQRSVEELEKEREWKRRKELLKQERAQKKREEEGMPIDPNEPVYCYCNRVSFGEMIACENDDCSREWFHLECVGLDRAPEGTWYCDDCIADLDIDPATMRPRR